MFASHKHHWLFAGCMAMVALIAGARAMYPWKPSAIDGLVSLASQFTLTWWVLADARARCVDVPVLARPNIFFFAPLAAPAYVVWSRGWLGLAWLFAFVVLFVVSFLAGAFAFGLAFAVLRLK
jgi:hypothetical protein